MPDILGVTNPVPGHDSNTVNRNISSSPQNNPNIQNLPDPSRVGRADNRQDRQDSNLQGDGKLRYDSNYQTFLKELRQTPGMAETLTRIFSSREGMVVSSGMQSGIAQDMAELMQMLRMDEGQLRDFLLNQMQAGTRFGGPFFAMLRSAFANASSEGVRQDILQFLKSYSDFSSTGHIEGSMLRNLGQMANTMPGRWAEGLRELTAQLRDGISAGDRQGNLQLLQRSIFPYMANYVKQTHDFGPPRALMTLLGLDAARYENGSESRLTELFHQLSGYGTLRGQLSGIDDQLLMGLLRRSGGGEGTATQFFEQLAATAGRAISGEGSLNVQQGFQNLMAALLINESVYMPINHYLLPLEWEGRLLFSELWVDPDAENGTKGQGGQPGRVMRFLLKLDVQEFGLFDVIITTQDKNVDLRVSYPESAAPYVKMMEKGMTEILTRNELNPVGITLRKMDRPVTITEVFPKIYEGRNSVNVKA